MCIEGASQGNLQNISLEIPRNQLVVLTGVSGSGKSTLAQDVIFQECQRQYLEAMGMQGIAKPKLGRLRHASPAICITQQAYRHNPRSTVGTVTDLYTSLRMVFEKLHHRSCPHCGQAIAAAQCREETERRGDDFYVYQYCSHCGFRMDKLTCSHFSHNTRQGACPQCQGLGTQLQIAQDRLFDMDLSLGQGAVLPWFSRYGQYQLEILQKAFAHYGLAYSADAKLKGFTEKQMTILLFGTDSPECGALFPDILPPKTQGLGKFEGLYGNLWRRASAKEGKLGDLVPYFTQQPCASCGGKRLNPLSLSAKVAEKSLGDLMGISLEILPQWVHEICRQLPLEEICQVENYLLDMETKIQRLCKVGLGYLTMERTTPTLSGGESQRLRLSAALDGNLSGILYILDEPTAGLHPKDTAGMLAVLASLRDQENTLLVIEHDTDVMAAADAIIDLGPGPGHLGGKLVAQGNLAEIRACAQSVTGQWLAPKPLVREPRSPQDQLWVRRGTKFNLRGVDVAFPTGCLTAVTGVSGSGKSTLVFQVLAKNYRGAGENAVEGPQFEKIVLVEQGQNAPMSRSNPATYLGIYDEIRKIFASQPKAKECGLAPGDFSFNRPGGRCEHCQGMGQVTSNLLFFEDIQITCPVCAGQRFGQKVLAVEYEGHSILQVLGLEVTQALALFGGKPALKAPLELLQRVGLGYLPLGQALPTLSGGELQRLHLARELLAGKEKATLYLVDEPTVGLHPADVAHFIVLLQALVEQGNTVIVVEHNPQLISQADWVIDLGPGGGEQGGQLLAQGTPWQLAQNPSSATGKYLAPWLG